MGFSSVPANLVPWLIRYWSVILDRIALQLYREGIKGREDSERRGGEGDNSRETIILNISIKGGGGGG